MAYAWQSVEEAAVTLAVSSRTLHRRISKGEVETRLENGRREVLVCLPDDEPEETDVPDLSDPSDDPVSQPSANTAIVLAEQQIALANDRVRRTEVALVAFQQTSQILQSEVSRTRLSARFAWIALALCSVGVYVAVGWTATKVSQVDAEKKYLHKQLDNVATEVKETRHELVQVRNELSQAQQSAARLEGELTATKSAFRPATQPTFLEALGKKLAAGSD
jgi:cell division protein FtsB